MEKRKIIKTIDLWTERKVNDHTCLNGAFIDGFADGGCPFDSYKVIKNCNCIIAVSEPNINVTNKHQAIVFYNNKKPVRLFVANGATDLEKCIKIALNQKFNIFNLGEVYSKFNIVNSVIDLAQSPVFNNCSIDKEVDVGSCDRWSLLHNMLSGSYTEDNTSYGHYEDNRYDFIPKINIKYNLITDTEKFSINHNCAFINMLKTRIVPIQNNSTITQK